ncbi:MAG: hypothetical protein WHS82_02725 [Candidatus Methanosuratincola sp.]
MIRAGTYMTILLYNAPTRILYYVPVAIARGMKGRVGLDKKFSVGLPLVNVNAGMVFAGAPFLMRFSFYVPRVGLSLS